MARRARDARDVPIRTIAFLAFVAFPPAPARLVPWLTLVQERVPAPTNLLRNTSGELGLSGWVTAGAARVEEYDGNRCFVARNGGSFEQAVPLPPDAEGRLLLFIGRASAERIRPQGITGLPYLYGRLMTADGTRILSYLQGQRMMLEGRDPNEWATLWGVFPVATGTRRVVFSLNQALANGLPHDGAAARFDDVGLFLFATREEAEAFARRYGR